MLNYDDFKVKQINNSSGFAGQLDFLTCKANNNIMYIVKSNDREQSINEYVAQHILKALGFYAIPSVLIFKGFTYYGALRFMPSIKRIYLKNNESLSHSQIKTLIELIVLNGLLLNPDEGEFYINPNGDICSLDYGESIVGTFLAKISLSGMTNILPSSYRNITEQIHSNIYTTKEFCKKYGVSENFNVDSINKTIMNFLKRFSELDISLMNECFDAIDDAFYKGAADIYKNRIEDIKCASLEYIKQSGLKL